MARKGAGWLNEAKSVESKANEWLAQSRATSHFSDQFSVRQHYKRGYQIKSSLDQLVAKVTKGPDNRDQLDHLTDLKVKLADQLELIKPQAVEQDYFRQMESLYSDRTNVISPLEEVPPSSDEEDSEELDDEEIISSAIASDSDTEPTRAVMEVQAIGTFSAAEPGDISFKAGEILSVLDSSRDDGWLIVENALGEKGLAPGNYVTAFTSANRQRTSSIHHHNSTSSGHRKGKELWAKVKSVVKQTSLGDVLNAMGAIPSGFRESTLAYLLAENADYHMSSWLVPSLSPTFVSLVDLPWDHSKNMLAGKAAAVSRECVIVTARMIPTTGTNLTVLSRHIRIATFDGNNVLSNIHTIRAMWSAQEPRMWKFLQKTTPQSSSLFHRTFAIRMNNADPELRILFELGITVRREKTGDVKELSCGWATLPLFEQNGHPMASRAYELKINGGTPFEVGVELDPAQNIEASGRFIPALLRSRRIPKLYVQLVNSNKQTKTQLSWCPSSLITTRSCVPLIACYRQMLGSAFMRERSGSVLPFQINKPALGVFLRATDQPDVMDVLMTIWTAALKNAKRSERSNLDWMAGLLEKTLLENIYTLLHSTSLPQAVWANEDVENQRSRVIMGHIQEKSIPQRPFDVTEQLFSLYPSIPSNNSS
ncbi:nephrocystin-1-like isoform X2 [Dysidea avara]|uniref:nephrocystin-1-like isoform X2 n=1 Tax=Dysidea avara TaxID=196820 RepID=UPI00332986E6